MVNVSPQEINVQLAPISTGNPASRTHHAPMEGSGTPNTPNVCALRILSGMARIVSPVEVGKFTLETWDAAAPMECSSMEASVSPFLSHNARLSITLNGTAHSALVSLDIPFKECPASAQVFKLTDIVMSATPSLTPNGSMESVNALEDSMKISANACPYSPIPILPANPHATWLPILTINKRDVWPARMDVCPVPPAIPARNADQSITITPPKDFALRYVVMENVSLWHVMMETTTMGTAALRIVRLSLDSTASVARPTLLMSALLSCPLQSSSRNQAKPMSPTRYT